MANEVEEKARGILNPTSGARNFHLARYVPNTDLSLYVEHYWRVEWDLRGQAPYSSQTLAHPAVHLTIEPEGAYIVGIVTHKYERLLQGQGWVFGIKFTPAGFFPFAHEPISSYTDRVIPLRTLFGEAADHYEDAMRAVAGEVGVASLEGGSDGNQVDEARIRLAEDFLRHLIATHVTGSDENIALANQIVERISADRSITKVAQLVDHFSISKRGLQRLFSHYVGATPKWVIQRYRLHEATAQVGAGESIDWSQLAVELGYFDQAHFIKDFKAMIGMTPAEYAAGQKK